MQHEATLTPDTDGQEMKACQTFPDQPWLPYSATYSPWSAPLSDDLTCKEPNYWALEAKTLGMGAADRDTGGPYQH